MARSERYVGFWSGRACGWPTSAVDLGVPESVPQISSGPSTDIVGGVRDVSLSRRVAANPFASPARPFVALA